jgi:hypothetical protein
MIFVGFSKIHFDSVCFNCAFLVYLTLFLLATSWYDLYSTYAHWHTYFTLESVCYQASVVSVSYADFMCVQIT